jgi:hypothetical protein
MAPLAESKRRSRPRWTLLCATLAALTVGCSTTRVVPGPVSHLGIQQIVREHSGGTMYVETLAPAANVGAPLIFLRVEPEQTIVTAESLSGPFALRNADVRSVSVNDRLTGFWHGAGIGALIGAGVTTAIALSYTPCNDCVFPLSRGGVAVLSAVYIGLPIALVGGTIGAITGARSTYVFQ